MNADFGLRWEGDVSGSGEVSTTVERNAPVIFYPHYSSKKPFCSKDQCIEDIQDTPVFLHLFPFSPGSSTEEQKPEVLAVGKADPKYGSRSEVLASQACPWYWEKNQQTDKKEKQKVACRRRKAMAIGGLAPIPPEDA